MSNAFDSFLQKSQVQFSRFILGAAAQKPDLDLRVWLVAMRTNRDYVALMKPVVEQFHLLDRRKVRNLIRDLEEILPYCIFGHTQTVIPEVIDLVENGSPPTLEDWVNLSLLYRAIDYTGQTAYRSTMDFMPCLVMSSASSNWPLPAGEYVKWMLRLDDHDANGQICGEFETGMRVGHPIRPALRLQFHQLCQQQTAALIYYTRHLSQHLHEEPGIPDLSATVQVYHHHLNLARFDLEQQTQ